MRGRFGLVVASWAWIGVCGAAAGEIRTLALSSAQAPDAAPGVLFTVGFGPPSMNGVGGSAFPGALTGTGVDFLSDRGVYASVAGGALSQSARAGQALPGASGATLFAPMTLATPTDAGAVVFQTGLFGAGVTGANDVAICRSAGGVLSVVAREGDPAPGAEAGAVFGTLDGFHLSPGGRVAFTGLLSGAGVNGANDAVVYAGTPGMLVLAAREGEPAPGIGPGTVYEGLSRARANDAGDVAFVATLAGGGVGGTNAIALYGGPASSPALRARAGDPLPGAGADTYLGGFGAIGLDEGGCIIAFATLSGTDVSPSDDTVILSVTAGGASVLLREGGPAPGLPGLSAATPTMYVDHSGRIAFVSTLFGPGVTASNNAAAYSEQGGIFTLLARKGDVAQGAGGAVYAGFPQGVRTNASGDAAFLATLTGTGVTGSNDTALYFVPAGGMPELVVRTGTAFDVDDSLGVVDLRVPSLLVFTQSNDSALIRSPLSNDGSLAFLSYFADGSAGVFVRTSDRPCAADLAAPFGVLNVFDIQAYIGLYIARDPAADLAAPFGVFNIFDVQAYIGLYNAGCP